MNTSSDLTILVSGPRRRTLIRAWMEWFDKANLKGVTPSKVRLPKRNITKSVCPVDVLRIKCPARESLLKKVVKGLHSVTKKESTQKRKNQDIWIRVSGAYSVPIPLPPEVKEKDVADRFLMQIQEAKTDQKREISDKEYAKLHVAAFAGEVGVNEFEKSLTCGKSVEEAAEEAMNSPNLPDRFDEVSCVF